MVAELLRLRLRLVGNLFRGRAAAGRILAVLVAVALVALVFAGIRMLDGSGPQFTARSIVGVGALASLGALLVPVIAARHELMPARAFLGLGVPRTLLIPLLALLTLLGPAVLTVSLAFAPLAAWPARDAATVIGCGLLLLAQTLLSLRIGAAVGAALRTRRRLGPWMRALSVLALAVTALPAVSVVLTRAFLLVPDRSVPAARALLPIVRPIDASGAIDVLAASPLGALWAAPALPELGQGDRTAVAVLTGVAAVLVLALAWSGVVLRQLSATRRHPDPGARHAPGWFGRLPASPAGAVAARSMAYWLRDPRYRTVFAFLPVIPVLTLLALAIGGVPFPVAALVPLPLMVLVLAWSTLHNDVAYDGTAVWLHLASDTRGIDDRVGRSVPPLVFGAILVAVGAPLTAWAYGDVAILPVVLGVSLAVLLGGVGVGSGLSALFPYPAPRPGDGPFRQPQLAGGSGAAVQGLSVLLIVLTAVPALVVGGIWLAIHGGWNWVALLVGLAAGGAALVFGISAGAAAFDRRGPELLAFAMRN